MKSISGLVFYVKDIKKSSDFYESIGFYFEKREAELAMFRLNWFWAELRQGQPENAGGPLVYVNVDNVDEFYQGLIVKHIRPASEPQETNGRREFTLQDPDGYNLVFFQKI